MHEKSALMPMLPLALLYAFEPAVAAAVLPLAAFSMFPLLERDGQALPYTALAACAAAVAPDLAAAWPALKAAARRERTTTEAPQPVADAGVAESDAGDDAAEVAQSAGPPALGRRVLGRVVGWVGGESFWLVFRGSCAIACGLHVARVVIEPPERIRFLHDLLMTVFAFVHFAAVMVYCNVRQLSLPADAP